MPSGACAHREARPAAEELEVEEVLGRRRGCVRKAIGGSRVSRAADEEEADAQVDLGFDGSSEELQGFGEVTSTANLSSRQHLQF